MDIQEKISRAPEFPGVYLMKNSAGEVIYIGKAKSLKSRLSYYIGKNLAPKTYALMENVTDIEYMVCNAESMALLLEANLIQQYTPKYNVSLRDNKSYPYIEITHEEFPRIFISRPKNRKDKLLFGPYPRSKTLKEALGLIRKIFPYRSCVRLPKRECLFYHLKLCAAPCIGKVSHREYKEIVEDVERLLQAKIQEIIIQLKTKMDISVKNKDFETAAQTRDKIIALENIYSGRAQSHELILLKEFLNLPRIPLWIDAVDISSLSGQNASGSVVVFKNGQPDKNNYRRFRIKEVSGVDDYAMMAEVVRRRYERMLREKQKLPDLLLVDGGQGHVQSVRDELSRLGVSIALVGLAKRHEELWLPNKNTPVLLERTSGVLRLLQRIRDEAHRFAHTYHVWRRKKTLIEGNQ